MPIVVILGYLCLTVLLFATSPWAYPVQAPQLLYGFLVLAHAALLAGYLWAVRSPPGGYRGRWSITEIVALSVAVNLVLLYPTAVFRTGGSIDVASALDDPGRAYAASFAARFGDSTPTIEYVRMLLGPIIVLLLPMTVFYWSRLGVGIRLLAIAAQGGVVAMFMAMGTNKAIADTVMLTPWIIAAGHLSGISRLSRKSILAIGITAVVGLAGFGMFFTKTQGTRTGSSASVGYFAATGVKADYDNFMIRDLSPEAQIGVLGINLYVTQGYYALSLALDEPFVPMWGFGNSMFLYRQVAKFTGDASISESPYPVRIERKGWDAYQLWSSIYPWLASDFSFPGTILVVFLIGVGFARSWRDTLQGENPFAVAVFGQFVVMLLYFPANNQLMQAGESFIAFWVTLALWISTRKKRTAHRGARAS
jgi:hypothetical protein